VKASVSVAPPTLPRRPRGAPARGASAHKAAARRLPELDGSIPVLLVKVGHYPLHHGTVGAIRSLGRLGVPVYAIVEDQFTPAARSRHLTRRFCWSMTGREQSDELVEGLLRIGRAIGERAIVITTDDEAAVLVAEHAERLARRFILPATPPALPRQLAGKQTLHSLCLEHGIPSPVSLSPRSAAEALEAAATLGFPLVVKNDEPWLRLTRPAVASTAIIRDRLELRRLVASWTTMPSALMQEYVPPEIARDWIAHAYVGEDPEHCVIFTGRKLRSWPPQAGVTTYAYTRWNAELSALTREFCRAVGFRGICDLDWRFDARSGQYKLLDFNPRLGAQFRLFERGDGVDVVRAMHLDLTGREVRAGDQVDGRRYIVENLDLPAAIASGRAGDREAAPAPPTHRELAWLAADDPMPALLACGRSVAHGSRKILTRRLGSYRVAE
jgi:predicted ATP-grasp superfamily ATP-dependent carboligase